MENDALEEDGTSNYKWDGERLPVELRMFEELVNHSITSDIIMDTN